jgi:hypothetical protein
MTEDQFRIIKRKQQGKSDEEKWYRIFGILFPGATPPKSPCMYVCDSWRVAVAHADADPDNDTLQAGVSDFIRFFRRRAPGILNDEIRARITSTIDLNLGLGFREGYLLDLILHEAVTCVVQTLTTDHSRRYDAAARENAEAGL